MSRPTQILRFVLSIRGCHPLRPGFPAGSGQQKQKHWPDPRSLATTNGVLVDVLSSGYLDVSVPRVRSYSPMNSENKSLLVISVGPKTALFLSSRQASPLEDPLQQKTDEPARHRKRSSACAALLRQTARLFGATEIEGGFPHSEIFGSKPVRGSPKLIAAYHVLHRLSAPRHPPDTLMALDCSHRQSAFVNSKVSISRGSSDRQIGSKHTLARKDQFCFKRIRGF